MKRCRSVTLSAPHPSLRRKELYQQEGVATLMRTALQAANPGMLALAMDLLAKCAGNTAPQRVLLYTIISGSYIQNYLGRVRFRKSNLCMLSFRVLFIGCTEDREGATELLALQGLQLYVQLLASNSTGADGHLTMNDLAAASIRALAALCEHCQDAQLIRTSGMLCMVQHIPGIPGSPSCCMGAHQMTARPSSRMLDSQSHSASMLCCLQAHCTFCSGRFTAAVTVASRRECCELCQYCAESQRQQLMLHRPRRRACWQRCCCSPANRMFK